MSLLAGAPILIFVKEDDVLGGHTPASHNWHAGARLGQGWRGILTHKGGSGLMPEHNPAGIPSFSSVSEVNHVT